MKIQSIYDASFARYGQVVEGYDLTELSTVLLDLAVDMSKPSTYRASVPELEALAVFGELQQRYFGGREAQLGICYGCNTKLNGVEYHRSSELVVAALPCILLLGSRSDICGGRYDTAHTEAFLMPAGAAVELFSSTLHYAPCQASEEGFCTAVLLPRGTNTPLAPGFVPVSDEDRYLAATDKWLLVHSEAAEAKNGCYIGVIGENLDVAQNI